MIDNYTPDRFHELMVEWTKNVEYGTEDGLLDFRHAVLEIILPSIGTVNLDLLKDLYLEQAKCAYENCGVHIHFNLVGGELVRRGGEKYLMDFYKGSALCQGSCLISIPFDLDRDKALTALDFLKDKIVKEIDCLNYKLRVQMNN